MILLLFSNLLIFPFVCHFCYSCNSHYSSIVFLLSLYFSWITKYLSNICSLVYLFIIPCLGYLSSFSILSYIFSFAVFASSVFPLFLFNFFFYFIPFALDSFYSVTHLFTFMIVSSLRSLFARSIVCPGFFSIPLAFFSPKVRVSITSLFLCPSSFFSVIFSFHNCGDEGSWCKRVIN